MDRKQAKAEAKPLLSDYIHLGPAPKGMLPVMTVKLPNRDQEVSLLKHPSEWPRKFLQEHWLDVLYVFGELFRGDVEDAVDYKLCLCITSGCERKTKPSEKRDCPYFSAGCCTAATQKLHNGEEHSYAFIGMLHGRTKQGIQSLAEESRETLMQHIRRNPYLLEILSTMQLEKAKD